MNKQTQKAIAYVQNALSFIFLDATIINKCNAVYLFGSAARGEMEKESDIDLFFDFENEEDKNETRINAAIQRFYQSQDYQKWKLLAFTFPFSIKAGKLQAWELKTSVFAEGILLYSKEALVPITKRYILITYTLPKKKTKYLFFVRTLFGRKEEGYKDTGLAGACQAKKIGSIALLVAQDSAQPILSFLQKEKITYSFMEIGIIS